MTFIAAFDGQPCGTCDVRIREGDEVEYDLSNRLVHAVCPESLGLDDPAPYGTCDRCFLTLPLTGICGSC